MTLEQAPAARAHSKTVIHCSDLHYGRGFHPEKAEQLLRQIHALQPDAVVFSGDFTMRARKRQFAGAREFLQRLSVPRLVIPGNHDVPLYNLFARFRKPFGNYNQFIADLGTNPIEIDGVGIIGINSINPRRHQKGIFTHEHLAQASHWLKSLPSDTWRIVVTHQHFVAIPGFLRPGRFRDAERILMDLSQGGAHAVLCGHMHYKYVGSTRDFFPGISRPVALVAAGTPTSGRVRSYEGRHVNNFIVLRFHRNQFEATPFDWNASHGEFLPGEKSVFDRSFFGEQERPDPRHTPHVRQPDVEI